MNDFSTLDNQQLQRLVEKVSMEFFQKPFVHQAYFNKRLKTTGGRYHLATHNIDINPKVVEKYGMNELLGVIKHELCHYHLHLAGQGYQHRDSAFKNLLKITGGSRFVPPLSDEKKQLYNYQCSSCKQKFLRSRKINLQKFVCGKCGKPLKLMDTAA